MSLYRSAAFVAILCFSGTEAVRTSRIGIEMPTLAPTRTTTLGRLLSPRGLAADEIESRRTLEDSILAQLLPATPCANVTLSNTPWAGSYTRKYAKFLVDHDDKTGNLTSTVFTALWTRNPDTYTVTDSPVVMNNTGYNTTDNTGYNNTLDSILHNTTYTTTDEPTYNTTIAPTTYTLDTNYTLEANSTRALAATQKHSVLDSMVEGTLILYDMVQNASAGTNAVHECYWILYGGRDLEEKLAAMTPSDFIGSMSSASSFSQDPSVFPIFSTEECSSTSPENLVYAADTLWNMYESAEDDEPNENVILDFGCSDE